MRIGVHCTKNTLRLYVLKGLTYYMIFNRQTNTNNLPKDESVSVNVYGKDHLNVNSQILIFQTSYI